MGKKKYKKQLLKSLKSLGKSEHLLLESMTNLMLLGELKKNNIEFKDGDTFSFKDNIFDYSEDKNIRKMAKLRHKMMKTMNKLVEKNNFKDKEIKFWRKSKKQSYLKIAFYIERLMHSILLKGKDFLSFQHGFKRAKKQINSQKLII
jgi:hypothetical protein